MSGRTNAPKVSLVIADVDGALVTEEKVLALRVGAAVRGLHAAGIAFAIPGKPARPHRIPPSSLRCRPGHDGQSWLWRSDISSESLAEDPRAEAALPGPCARSRDRGRWRPELRECRSGARGRGKCNRRRLCHLRLQRRRRGDRRHPRGPQPAIGSTAK